MIFFLKMIGISPDMYLFKEPIEWLILGISWILFLVVIIGLVIKWRGYNKQSNTQFWVILFLLIVLVPITSRFLGVSLSPGKLLPFPYLSNVSHDVALNVFAALPFIIAGGLLGPTPAAILGAFSGLLLSYWNTRSPFTPLEYALLAVLFSAAMQQRYRTMFYHLVRHPIFTAILLTILYPIIHIIEPTVMVGGDIYFRLDIALTSVSISTLVVGGQLLVAGLISEVIALTLPSAWGGQGELRPSPGERSLRARFLYSLAPAAIALFLVLLSGNWILTTRATRELFLNRMASEAHMVALEAPYFLVTGEDLIRSYVEDRVLDNIDDIPLSQLLSNDSKRFQFFTKFILLDDTGNYLTSYPGKDYRWLAESTAIQENIPFILGGLPHKIATLPPEEEGKSAQIAFMVPVESVDGEVKRILVGITQLENNFFVRPVLDSLENYAKEVGEGMLLDKDGQILSHPESDMVMTSFNVRYSEEPFYYEDTAPDGTRRLVYYYPIVRGKWAVLLTAPYRSMQQTAFNIGVQLLAIIAVLVIITVFMLRHVINTTSSSLKNLSLQAQSITQGKLDNSLPAEGVDEIGELSRTFEQMRISLKTRLDELNRLLIVSQGVASSLDIKETIRPVLEATRTLGASSVRFVLDPLVVPNLEVGSEEPIVYTQGSSENLYKDLDKQVLALSRQKDQIVLNNITRPRLLKLPPNTQRPASIIAAAIRHENIFYGTMWVAYDNPHQFEEEEIRFLSTLAAQAAVATANSNLYLNAEIGRQLLAAILDSTPDPILVTDQQNRLLLTNPAAWRALGFGGDWEEGQPIEGVIFQEELIDLLKSHDDEKQSVEFSLPDGRAYYATATSVTTDGRLIGRVCVLRDITYFKELDTLKSDFVATVSHDLRSPLTLMRGYVMMLDMVGDLNKQQSHYAKKLHDGLEKVTRLVKNLLDLGRIETGIGLKLEMLSVHEIIQPVINELQMQASQKQLQLNVDISRDKLPQLEADSALLQLALHNLIENAVKYTPSKGQIEVRAEVQEKRMVFSVRDTGGGIAPVDQPRLFEKFYRGARQDFLEDHGTGLGLAIVKSIAERHGGQIWVESQLGQGSVFFLAIPLQQPEGDGTSKSRIQISS